MKTTSDLQKPVRWWDWPAVLLLVAALLVAATRLNATDWTEELDLIQTVTFLGVITGLALGQSIFSPSTVVGFAFVYGAFTIVWQNGLPLGEGVLWPERLVSMSNRLLITIDQLIQQKPVTDNLFFLVLMSILFWTLSVYAGYSLTRHGHPWRAILPIGLALVIIHAYDSFFAMRAWFLAGYLFLSLLLVARLHYLHLQKNWKENGTYLPPYTSLDSIRLGLLSTGLLVLLAWTVPALASAVPPAEQVWQRATQPWIAVRDRLGNAFSSLQASVGVVTDFYGDTLSLGRGNPLTDTVIMNIQAPPQVKAGVRYYWRSRVYDYYDGDWSGTLPTIESVTPDNFNLVFPEYEDRSTETFTIKTAYPIQNLHTPSQPIWISRPAQAYLAVNPDGTADLGLFKATPLLRAGEVYQVKASLTAASVAALRATDQEYPDWITARYLQLPDTITPRTRQLAAEVTAGLENPYDKAQAITDFLRKTISYSETVPIPPANQEPIDWILFNHRQAFCNYYATAEVILLRSLGIPARMAVGYAQGERVSLEGLDIRPTRLPGENVPQEISSPGDLYTVRHRDAHAWPEVYFPKIGWVEFEPTVSQLPILRPASDSQNPENALNTQQNANEQESLNRRSLDEFLATNQTNPNALPGGLDIPTSVWVLIAVLAVTAFVLLTRGVRRKRGSPPLAVQLEAGFRRVGLQPPSILHRWARFVSLSPLARAYRELNRALSRLGKSPQSTDTPAERASNLEQLLPNAATPIQTVLSEYQAATYGNRTADVGNAQLAGKEIRKYSYLAWLQRWLARFQEPTRGRRRLSRS